MGVDSVDYISVVATHSRAGRRRWRARTPAARIAPGSRAHRPPPQSDPPAACSRPAAARIARSAPEYTDISVCHRSSLALVCSHEASRFDTIGRFSYLKTYEA